MGLEKLAFMDLVDTGHLKNLHTLTFLILTWRIPEPVRLEFLKRFPKSIAKLKNLKKLHLNTQLVIYDDLALKLM